MPLEWPSMRSMARCVLPVLVGPRTARTRGAGEKAPIALESGLLRRKASTAANFRASGRHAGGLGRLLPPGRLAVHDREEGVASGAIRHSRRAAPDRP